MMNNRLNGIWIWIRMCLSQVAFGIIFGGVFGAISGFIGSGKDIHMTVKGATSFGALAFLIVVAATILSPRE